MWGGAFDVAHNVTIKIIMQNMNFTTVIMCGPGQWTTVERRK